MENIIQVSLSKCQNNNKPRFLSRRSRGESVSALYQLLKVIYISDGTVVLASKDLVERKRGHRRWVCQDMGYLVQWLDKIAVFRLQPHSSLRGASPLPSWSLCQDSCPSVPPTWTTSGTLSPPPYACTACTLVPQASDPTACICQVCWDIPVT